VWGERVCVCDWWGVWGERGGGGEVRVQVDVHYGGPLFFFPGRHAWSLFPAWRWCPRVHVCACGCLWLPVAACACLCLPVPVWGCRYKNGVPIKGATGERLPLATSDSAAGSYGVYSCAVSTSSGQPIPEADVVVHVERKGDLDEGASSGASGNTVRGSDLGLVSGVRAGVPVGWLGCLAFLACPCRGAACVSGAPCWRGGLSRASWGERRCQGECGVVPGDACTTRRLLPLSVSQHITRQRPLPGAVDTWAQALARPPFPPPPAG
jgi:hypothetical protein